MACSDDRSGDLIEAAKLAQIRVPEDIAVVGVDNDTLVCELSNPTLSSVSLDTENAGYKAAELFDWLMDGAEKMNGQKIMINPTFVEVRHSTDVLAVEDAEVLSAMSYIKTRVLEPIQVEDVVDSTCICRRSLERRFLQTIGRSIHAEICRARIEELIKMLIETNMTQLQITHAMGYGSIDNLRRFCHRETGMTPLEYRKKHRQ
jgi:LacI family transcriptional regulator